MKRLLKIFSIALVLILLISTRSVSFIEVSAATILESENNDTYATANIITANSNTQGVISSYKDIDLFKFVPQTNGIMTINFNHTYESKNEAWSITIYMYKDGAYSSVDGRSVRLSENESIKIIKLGVEKNTAYFIRIAPYVSPYSLQTNNVNGKKYNFDCSFNKSNNYEIERNETYQTANVIQVGTTISGNIFDNSKNHVDVDMFKFTASKNGCIKINFKHTYFYDTTQNYWVVSVYKYENYEYSLVESYEISVYDKENVDLGPIQISEKQDYYIRIGAQGSAIKKEYTFTARYDDSSEKTTKQESTTKKVTETTASKNETTTRVNSTTTTTRPVIENTTSTTITATTETTTFINENIEVSTTTKQPLEEPHTNKFILDLEDDKTNNNSNKSGWIIIVVALSLFALGIIVFIVYTINKERIKK